MNRRILFTVLYVLFANVLGVEESPVKMVRLNRMCASCNQTGCCGQNTLNLCSLCSDKIMARCIESDTVAANKVCATQLVTDQLCTSSINLNKVCADEAQFNRQCNTSLSSANLCAQNAAIGALCTDTIVTNSICITGNYRQCSSFSSRIALSTDVTYTLGDPVPFDSIISDPSNAFQFSPTRWITPESGTYILTAQIRAHSLNGPSLIAGTPVGVLEIWINGMLRRQQLTPYLAFSDGQSTILTTLVSSMMGDEVIVRYKVLIQDSSLGLIEYPGIVTLVGSPGFTFRSFMYIHYLSSDCSVLECPPCEAVCQPCSAPCAPVCNIQPCAPCCQTPGQFGLREDVKE